jgi:hypothetical protein
MTPTPDPQQDLNALEKVGKIVGSLVVLTGAFAGLVRWLRRRAEARDAKRAAFISRVVRTEFKKELDDLDTAARRVEHVANAVEHNSKITAEIQTAITTHLGAGDELTGLLVGAVRANTDWLDDLQNLCDHAFGIDRRSSVGMDRRAKIDERYDAIENRRTQRRRAADRLSEMPKPIDSHNEVT